MPEVQNELIRLSPVKETTEAHAIEVCKAGDTYFVYSILKNGAVASSAKCESLAVAFATVADLLTEAPNAEYFVES